LCLGLSLWDVRRVLPHGHISVSTGLRVGIQMLRAIQSFHERGFVHRSVKPSNFMLRPGKPKPALIDFGLARANGTSRWRRSGRSPRMR
jgi:serine/threonine protein kinase